MTSRGRLPNNTTSISLHERFSKLRTAAGGKKLSGKLQEARTYATQLQKASRQNNRVAQQMERRNAALNAALKIKKKSIKQRLGVANKTALAVGSKARVNVALKQKKLAQAKSPARANVKSTKKPITAPSTPNTVRGRGSGRILSQTFTRGGGRTPRGRGNKQAVVANVSNRGQAKSPRGRGAGRGGQVQRGSPNKTNRNQVQRGRGQQQQPSRGQSNQRGRGQQGRGRGRGQRGRGGPNKKVSREDLDKQLDQYMSKTRHALDEDLEKYMLNKDSEMS